MKNYDDQVNFEQGGDTGENDAESTQPFEAVDVITPETLNRPGENLRARTEVLRAQIETLNHLADYDRAFVLKSNATFTFAEPDAGGDPGAFALTMTGDDLIVYPALSPGLLSGGRSRGAKLFTQQGLNWLPYAGTAGVNDLILIASAQYTGMRGYADADDFATDVLGVSVGANRLRLEIVANPALAGGVGNITAAVVGSPATKITLTIGTLTPTTVADVIAFINADASSQGTYGLRHLFRASTTGPGTVAAPTFTDGEFQGGYDAEAYKVTPAALSAFFAASVSGGYPNRLREGDGLAIAFTLGPVERDVAAAKGGRRQSLHDWPSARTGGSSDNTAPASGWNLFNTAREPEKIPGSVPVGKMLNGRFVFIDGTNVGVTAISLTESHRSLARLAATTGTPGAELVGYGGSGAWNADAAAATEPAIPAGTVEASLDTAVAHLASLAAGNSGARRVGAEAIAGSATPLNTALSLTAGSVRSQLAAVLNTPASPSSPGGVNGRVSEYGHVLKGPLAITKDLSTVSLPTAAGQRFSALHSGAPLQINGVPNYSGRQEFADFIVQPLGAITATALPVLLALEAVTAGSTSSRLCMTGATISTRYATLRSLFPTMNTYSEIQPGTKAFTGTVVIALFGSTATGNDGDGYYFFEKFTNNTTYEIQLKRLDGTAANFTGTTFTGAFIMFCNSKIIGMDASSHREMSYHMSEFAAENVSALGSAFVPWKEVYIANPTLGADATKASAHFAQRSLWRPTEAIPRDSDHILSAADYAALAGSDTGMVDATAGGSHHHDNTIGIHTPSGADIYTGLSAYDTLLETLIATNPTFTQIQAAGGGVQPASSVMFRVPSALIPASTNVSHVIVRVEHELVAVSGAAGMRTLNASYTLAAGSTDPYSGGPGSFTAPAGGPAVSQNPRLITYSDSVTEPALRQADVHILPVGNYYYNSGGPSVPGAIYIRYADNGFSGDLALSRLKMRLIGLVKTR